MKHRDLCVADPVRQRGEPVPLKIERGHGGAVQECAEQGGNRAAEARILDEAQSVSRCESQRVRVAEDVVQDAAMRIGDTLGCARGTGGVEDISDRVAAERPVRNRTVRLSIITEDISRCEDRTAPGENRAAKVQVRVGGKQRRRVEVVDHPAQDRSRQSMVQRCIRQAGFENTERPYDRFIALRE